MSKILIKNAKIVNENSIFHGDVLIDGEYIIDIQNSINPHNLDATIIDAEIDPVECRFDYSNTITIDTKNLTYIVLTPENLRDMISLIDESEALYSAKYD